MNTPDFTPPAIAGIILAIITNAIVLLGLDATDAQKAAITGLVNALVVVAFLVHDAVVRHGRATGAPGRAQENRISGVSASGQPGGFGSTKIG